MSPRQNTLQQRARRKHDRPATARERSPRSPARRAIWPTAGIGIVLLALGLIAFAPALHAPFSFDDLPAIVHNPSIRALWPPSVPLTTPPLGTPVSGRPVANYSFAVDYMINRVAGAAPMDSSSLAAPGSSASVSFHATNLFLHVIGALLLFLAVRDVIRRGQIPDTWRDRAAGIAFAVAAIWVVHPLQTEAVDYVAQRTEVLVSVWYLLTLYAALRAWSSARPVRWSVVAVVASTLGMATKEVMITAPLMVVLLDRAFLYETWREPWTKPSRRNLYVGLFATMLVAISLVAAGGRSETVGFHLGVTWYEYALSQAWAVVHYLTLAAWPYRLMYDYGARPIVGAAVFVDLAIIAVLIGLTILAWLRDSWRWAGFLGAWFFLILSPSSSIIPIQTEIAAERRVYLALAAVIVLVVVAVDAVLRTYVPRAPKLGVALTVLVVAALALRSVARSRMYVNPELLWADALHERPDNPRAYNGLAVAVLQNDPRPPRLAEADTLIRHALAIDSTFVPARISAAAIAIKQDRLPDAERILLGTLRFDPNDAASNEKLGSVLVAEGKPEQAIPYLVRLDQWRADPQTLTNLGVAYLTLGQLDSAVTVLNRALQVDPGNVEAEGDLGGALIELNRGAEAIPHLTAALRADPSSGFNFAVLSVAYAEAGQPDLAGKAAVAATERAPNDAATLVFAGRGLQRAGRAADAEPYLARAVQLQPNEPQALTRLAISEMALGRRAQAKALLDRALAVAPSYELARKTRAALALPADPHP